MKKKPKNIPSPYKSTGTPIYRDTTALPFDEGGNMENPPIQFPSTFPFNYNYNFLNPNYKVVNENPNAGTESWLNPMNWFVPRMDQETTFNNAFEKAKRSGYSEFIYNGKRYNTKSNMTPAQQMKVYGITDEQRITDPWQPRKNLSTMNTEEGYSGGAEIAFNRMLGNSPGLNFPSNEADSPGAKEQDAFKLYLGLPQSYNTFQPSKYKKGALELTGYNALLPDIMPSDKELEKYGVPKYSETWGNQKNPLKPYDDFVMGRHTVKKGKDSRGEYIEYIDKWDLDTYKYNIDNRLFNAEVPVGSMADMLNKPFDIYGRKYYKDYGDGVKKTMYYSDQELQSFNPKNKNFDTLALQKELANRGYKFPKSTTKSGEFDGVYGEETKKALQDWQSKNFQPGETYTFSGRPGSYYKYTEEGNMLIKNKNTGGKYIPMTDEDGKRLKTLQAGLATGKTKKFLDGGPLVDKTNHGDLLPSVYASALGNYYADGGPQPIKGSMYTYTSKDGTVTNKFVNTEGNTVVQVKTPNGKYYEKILPTTSYGLIPPKTAAQVQKEELAKGMGPTREAGEKITQAGEVRKAYDIQTAKMQAEREAQLQNEKMERQVAASGYGPSDAAQSVDWVWTLPIGASRAGINAAYGLGESAARALGTNISIPALGYVGPTYGSALNASFMGYGASQLPETYRKIKKGAETGDYREAIGATASNLLDFLGAGEAKQGLKLLGQDIKQGYNTVATGNSFIPYAWKVERPNFAIKSSDYIARPYTDAEAELLSTYGKGMRFGSQEEWDAMEALTKSGATDFSKGNYPISRTIGYYNRGSAENKAIEALKRGDVFATPTEESIRTWSAGVPDVTGREYLQGKTRLIIPSRYTKDLGSHFSAMPYDDVRVGFIHEDPVTGMRPYFNFNAARENELMGNIPGGFKVIGRSSEDGMNNLIIKPIRNRAESGLQANTNKNSTSGLVQSDVSKTVDDGYGPLTKFTQAAELPVAENIVRTAEETQPTWTAQNMPGLHLKSTMSNGPISKIVEPKTGLINVEQALGIIGKEAAGADKVALIKKGLGETIPKKMNFNDFRKVVQDQLVPLERQFATHRSDYGLKRINYSSGDKKTILEEIDYLTERNKLASEDISDYTNYVNNPQQYRIDNPDTNPARYYSDEELIEMLQSRLEDSFRKFYDTADAIQRQQNNLNDLPLENKTLILSNKDKLGIGSSAHSNPEETLGHIHFLRNAETPDVLTVTQIQSDAFQGTHRIMPSKINSNPEIDKWKKILTPEGRKELIEIGGEEAADLAQHAAKQFLEQAEKEAIEVLGPNPIQKQLLDKNHQERYLQELVNYSAERGDISKIQLPTSETAAKVQGYKKHTLDEFRSDIAKAKPEEIAEIEKKYPKFMQDVKEGNFTEAYDPSSSTIIKKYSDLPKNIKKLFGVEPKVVTDSKGNTWYEFDIPESFKQGKGEIQAFKKGGFLVTAPAAIGLDAAVEGSTNNYAKGGMIKRADGSYSPRGLWDNIRAAAAKNKAAGKPGKEPSKEMLAQAKKIEAEEKQLGGYLYGRGGQFPTPYSLPEDSFKQGGDNLHNSVYASSMAQYPATYAEGGLLDTNPEPTPELDNRTKTMMYLLSKGLDLNQAAGIAGNLEQESGFNPTARNKSGYTGIAQWDKKNRWPAVKKYIESQGLDPWSLEGQLEGLYWEANKRGDWNKIAQTTNPAESTAAWLKYFERSGEKPGQAGYEKRINYANNLAADKNVLNKVLAFSPPNINELPLEEFPLITNEVPQTFNNNYIEEVEPRPVETPVFFPTNSPTSLMNLANIQRLNTLKYGGSFQMPRQQMYMPLDNVERLGGPQHNAYRKGGSVFYATNTPQLEGEGKDLTYPQNAYIYTSGGLINNFNIKRYEL